jgi:hypothetical protein
VSARDIYEHERQRREWRRAMSVQIFCVRFNIGRTKAYEEIKAGRLRARKAGRRTIITTDDADEWLSRLTAMNGATDIVSPGSPNLGSNTERADPDLELFQKVLHHPDLSQHFRWSIACGKFCFATGGNTGGPATRLMARIHEYVTGGEVIGHDAIRNRLTRLKEWEASHPPGEDPAS